MQRGQGCHFGFESLRISLSGVWLSIKCMMSEKQLERDTEEEDDVSLSHKLGLTAAMDVALEINTVRSCLDGLFTYHKESRAVRLWQKS